jgi:hypothetical protein
LLKDIKVVHLLEKIVMNLIWLPPFVFDWPFVMVGLGGLLLVVPHLFAIPILVLWVGLEKMFNQTWMWFFFLVGSHIEHH